MIYYIVVIIIYEVFAGLQTEFFRQGITSAVYEQSALERKIFSSGSSLDLIFSTFGTIARINGIAFLIYLGYKTVWWHPIVFWVLGLLFIMLFANFCRGKIGFIIPAFLAFLVLPVSAIYLWNIV
ncbi:MAG: hypothetical protein GQ548_01240 [Methylophaga sp.]|nr:hypothetical protein [Methylophaga sp.]